MPPVQHKVWLYILRAKNARAELLVFEHTHVDAGIQIPAGTVEPNESFEHAAHRELFEESGVRVAALKFLGESERTYQGETVHAHWFAGWTPTDLPDEWTHPITGSGGDRGMEFQCYWLPQQEWHSLFGDFILADPRLDQFSRSKALTEIK